MGSDGWERGSKREVRVSPRMYERVGTVRGVSLTSFCMYCRGSAMKNDLHGYAILSEDSQLRRRRQGNTEAKPRDTITLILKLT